MLEVLDADGVRRWSRAALIALRGHQAEIDALNVFPVPDGDTGTNLMLTLLVADDAVRSSRARTAGGVLREFARAAVLGARGNSGVIASQLFRGLADAAGDAAVLDAGAFCHGLALGASFAMDAVTDPVEGTILSVARAAAEGVPGTGDVTLGECVSAAVDAARAALARTTEQLPVLAEAGVVDAGGSGFVVLLETLLDVVQESNGGMVGVGRIDPMEHAVRTPATATREAGSSEFAFEVQYLVHAPDEAIDVLRGQLDALGDSVVVVGTGDGTWNAHVHVNDVTAAVEAGKAAGHVYRLSVVRFVEQAESRRVSVVAVGIADGMQALFAGEGVGFVPAAEATPEHVAELIRAAGPEVVVLANGGATASVVEAAAANARDQGVRVAVIPTRSPVQALASVAVHDPARRFDDDVVAMAEAAAATRFAEVSVATEQSLTSIGICEAGDILGLIDGEVVEIGHGLVAVALALTDRLLGVGAELLTVVPGPEAPASLGDLMRSHVRDRAPFTEVVVYPAGGAAPPLVIGVE